jgi:hypothetical protein
MTWLVKLVTMVTTDLVMDVMPTASQSVEMESWTQTNNVTKEFITLTLRQTNAEPLAACSLVVTVSLTLMKIVTMVPPTPTPKRMLAELLAPSQFVVMVLLIAFTVKPVTMETPSTVMVAQALANLNVVTEKFRAKNNVIMELLTRMLFLMHAVQPAKTQPVVMVFATLMSNVTLAKTLLNVKAALFDAEMVCWNPEKNATMAFTTPTLNQTDVELTASCHSVETVFWTPWKSVTTVL